MHPGVPPEFLDARVHGALALTTPAKHIAREFKLSRALLYGVRFSSPVVVPDDDSGATLTVGGTVEQKNDDGTVVVGLTATVGGNKVLMGAKAVVRLS